VLRVILMRIVLVVGLLLSSGTMLGLSKVCDKESDKEKKGTLGCGALCCLILSGILLYHIVTV
jgi:hypothetical protein